LGEGELEFLAAFRNRASTEPLCAEQCMTIVPKLVDVILKMYAGAKKKPGGKVSVSKPKALRAAVKGSYLTIRPPWLFRILKGNKTLELRKQANNATSKLVHVGYGLKVYGRVRLGQSSPVSVEDLKTEEFFAKHRVADQEVENYAAGAPALHAWPVSDVEVFETPLELPPKKGTVLFRNFDDADEAIVAGAVVVLGEDAANCIEDYEREEMSSTEIVGKRKPKTRSKRARK
jgi:predicted transcriptional regulator